MIDVNCVPCFRKQAGRMFTKHEIPESRQVELMNAFNHYLENEGVKEPSPISARFLNRMLKQETGKEDLYLEEKEYYNKLLLDRYPELKREVEKSSDPLQTAAKYALAGNIIDFGPPRQFDVEETFADALKKPLAVDYSKQLFEAIRKAEMVLYLGDNAGEIVADKLFIEQLNHPNVYFAVRGQPVINDVIRADALQVGMDKVARIVDNGFDAPSTLPQYCSPGFRDIFDKADVVISKGQGNFEGLFKQVSRPNLFFMFMVKCEEIARVTGLQIGDAVILS
ncbi:damage-control phosphatase ARMT1 family protein [Marinilabilia sp.]